MEEIFSASDTRHLPQAILDLKTVNGKDYASQATTTPYIQFEIPASLGFVASEDITLNFDFIYTDTSGQVRKICPAEAQGIGGMIHQIDIYSIADGVLLESITDYETLNAIYVSSGVGSNSQVQSGQAKKMSIIESYVRDDEEVCPFWTPNADPNNPTTLLTTRAYQKQKICLPLRYSSLLGGSQVVPVGALGGLRVNIQTNPCAKFSNVRISDVLKRTQLEFLPSTGAGFDIVSSTIIGSPVGGVAVTITVPAQTVVSSASFLTLLQEQLALLQTALQVASAGGTGYTNRLTASITGAGAGQWAFAMEQFAPSGGVANPDAVIALSGTFFSLFTNSATYSLPKPTDNTAVPVSVDVSRTSALNVRYTEIFLANTIFGINTILDLNSCPFVVGQSLNFDAGGNIYLTPLITNISLKSDPLGTAPNANTHICLTFASFLPDQVTILTTGGAWTSSDTFTGVEYSLTNVSLTCPVVSPPPSYTIAMTKAIQSGEGLNMNIRTWSLQRGNTLTGQAQAVILIPSVQSKVRGVVSVPFKATNGNFKVFDLANNCNDTNISSYYFEYFGIRNPEQAVDTSKLAVGSRVPAELIWEQDKAFSSCFEESLETYQGYEEGLQQTMFENRTWFLGRALSQFNGFMDARLANLQLVVNATSSAGTLVGNWSWDNHLSVIHTLNIRPEGVKLMI